MMTCRCTAYGLCFFVQNSIAARLYLHRSSLREIKFNNFGSNVLSVFNPIINFVRQPKRFYLSNQRRIEDSERADISSPSNYAIFNNKNSQGGEAIEAIAELSPEVIDQLAIELAKNEKNHQRYPPSTNERAETQNHVNQAKKEDVKTPLMDLMKDIPSNELPPIDKNLVYAMKKGGLLKGLNKKFSHEPKPHEALKQKLLVKEPWKIEKERTKAKYPNGYRPLKKLSPDAMDGIRALHAQIPGQFTTARLAQEFKVSPEAIRRILKSKWKPNVKEALERESRWFKRGEQIWSRWAELGANPPKRFRHLGIGEKPGKLFYKPDPFPELITTSTRPGTTKNNSSGSYPDDEELSPRRQRQSKKIIIM